MNTKDNSDIENSSDEGDNYLAMLPTIEEANAETDMDSDASYDKNHALVHPLTSRLLNSKCDFATHSTPK